MTTTIDHTAYPHIVHAILAASDVSVATAFRGTSRAFKDRADNLLFAHVGLYKIDSNNPRTLGGTRERTFRFAWLSDLPDAKTQERGDSVKPPFVPNIPYAVRALDLDLDHNWDLRCSFNLARCSRLHTLRRTYGTLQTSKVIDLTFPYRYTVYPSDNSGFTYSSSEIRCIKTLVDFVTIRPRMELLGVPLPGYLDRYVLHIGFNASDPDWDADTVPRLNMRLRATPSPPEIVLVLKPHSSRQPHVSAGPPFLNELAYRLQAL
ncbi:hypothetical protein Q8F55_000072 [Vanrija albida]|uniref:HNH nuclease domain-containing protein n=1 Tax=Vanrija albida TaxID=181172 RepID=A0ABR3QC80_9TREE